MRAQFAAGVFVFSIMGKGYLGIELYPQVCYNWVVAKGDAREVGDRELELFQICQSTSLPGLSKFF